jgi:hypothetical protein
MPRKASSGNKKEMAKGDILRTQKGRKSSDNEVEHAVIMSNNMTWRYEGRWDFSASSRCCSLIVNFKKVAKTTKLLLLLLFFFCKTSQ